MKNIAILSLGLLFSTMSFAVSFTTTLGDLQLELTPVDQEMNVLDKFSRSTSMSTMCLKSENLEAVLPQFENVYLWMDMGHHAHGTSPVEISILENNCLLITYMDFVMAGEWQLHLTTADDKALFKFPVSR